MNLSFPLFAVLMANRLGNTSQNAGAAALLAMTIRPQMVALLMALLVLKQGAASTSAVTSNPTTGKAPSTGLKIVNQVIPKADHSFFPTFIDLTRKEAARLAKNVGLDVTFIDTQSGTGKEVVISQDPKPGSSWPRSVTEVTLYLG